MEQYFKTMLHPGNLGLDPASVQGTGLHLDTRPKFYRAIMRRLGVDMTHKINFKEFAKILKPSQPSNVLRAFGQNLDQNKVQSIYNMERELAKSIRDAEKGFYPLGPLLTFKHTKVRVKGDSNAMQSAENNPSSGDLRAPGIQSAPRSHQPAAASHNASFLQLTSEQDPYGAVSRRRQITVSRLVTPKENPASQRTHTLKGETSRPEFPDQQAETLTKKVEYDPKVSATYNLHPIFSEPHPY